MHKLNSPRIVMATLLFTISPLALGCSGDSDSDPGEAGGAGVGGGEGGEDPPGGDQGDGGGAAGAGGAQGGEGGEGGEAGEAAEAGEADGAADGPDPGPDFSVLTHVATLSGHGARLHDIEFSPDGARVATAGADGSVRIWEVSSGAHVVSLVGMEGAPNAVSWSPDGSEIVVATGQRLRGGLQGSLTRFDAATGAVNAVLVEGVASIWSADWSADGARIAWLEAGLPKVFDVAAGEQIEMAGFVLNFGQSIALNTDGTRMVMAGDGDVIRQTIPYDDNDWARTEVKGIPPNETWALWRPGDAQILVHNNRVAGGALFDADFESGARASRGAGSGRGGISGAAFSPDGRYVVTTSPYQELIFSDVESGQRIEAWDDTGSGPVDWSPDGLHVATAFGEANSLGTEVDIWLVGEAADGDEGDGGGGDEGDDEGGDDEQCIEEVCGGNCETAYDGCIEENSCQRLNDDPECNRDCPAEHDTCNTNCRTNWDSCLEHCDNTPCNEQCRAAFNSCDEACIRSRSTCGEACAPLRQRCQPCEDGWDSCTDACPPC